MKDIWKNKYDTRYWGAQKSMTVGKLAEILGDLPDDMLVGKIDDQTAEICDLHSITTISPSEDYRLRFSLPILDPDQEVLEIA